MEQTENTGYKVNDWVTKITGESHFSVAQRTTDRISKLVDYTFEGWHHFHLEHFPMGADCSHNPKHFRPATPKEIERAIEHFKELELKVGDCVTVIDGEPWARNGDVAKITVVDQSGYFMENLTHPQLDREFYLGHRRRHTPGPLRARQVPRRHSAYDGAAADRFPT